MDGYVRVGAKSPFEEERRVGFWRTLGLFLKLGVSSFGGPVAHLGYFHREFVSRRGWLKDEDYSDLVVFCQFLPGPVSSQVGFSIGLKRGGLRGGAGAWLGFTLPSALIMVAFALGINAYDTLLSQAILKGFRIMAVAVVAQAVGSMAVKLCPDKSRASVAIASAVIVLLLPSPWTQVGVIVVSGVLWYWLFRERGTKKGGGGVPVKATWSFLAVGLFLVLLVGLPFVANLTTHHSVALVDSFYRIGALVFGGGHVVLPLMQTEVVSSGWIGEEAFLAGYGAAQALPGPLFAFSAYLGAASEPLPHGWLGGALALGAVYCPSWLLVVGVLPFWEKIKRCSGVRSALNGINAAVVGFLLAALYVPVWTKAIHTTVDFTIAMVAFGLLRFWKGRRWAVLAFCAVARVLF